MAKQTRTNETKIIRTRVLYTVLNSLFLFAADISLLLPRCSCYYCIHLILATNKKINNENERCEISKSQSEEVFLCFRSNKSSCSSASLNVVPMKHDAGSLLLFLQRLDN